MVVAVNIMQYYAMLHPSEYDADNMFKRPAVVKVEVGKQHQIYSDTLFCGKVIDSVSKCGRNIGWYQSCFSIVQ